MRWGWDKQIVSDFDKDLQCIAVNLTVESLHKTTHFTLFWDRGGTKVRETAVSTPEQIIVSCHSYIYKTKSSPVGPLSDKKEELTTKFWHMGMFLLAGGAELDR